jgi:hypothetical protein
MIISKRSNQSKTGWVFVENKEKDICDRCQNKLWIAPNGKVYCDKENCGKINK